MKSFRNRWGLLLHLFRRLNEAIEEIAMQCPGQDSRYWDGAAVFEAKCPKCDHIVEFFKDDSTRKCSNCGNKMINPQMDLGCASYCPYAEQCLGSMPPELLAKKKELLVERVPIEMKRYFESDFKRIGHATKVARYAEKICKEENAHPVVTTLSAYLHDIGIKEAERKYNSALRSISTPKGRLLPGRYLTSWGQKRALSKRYAILSAITILRGMKKRLILRLSMMLT